jgi:hypothetical protein
VIPTSLGGLLQRGFPRKLGLQFTKPASVMWRQRLQQSRFSQHMVDGGVGPWREGEPGNWWLVVEDGFDCWLGEGGKGMCSVSTVRTEDEWCRWC